jgi:hypothetical protein
LGMYRSQVRDLVFVLYLRWNYLYTCSNRAKYIYRSKR